jgi:hypothetical protein
MAIYTITAEIPMIWTFRVEADNMFAALAQVENDEVDPDDKFTDFDNSTVMCVAVDGEAFDPKKHA